MKPLLFIDFDGTICHDRFWRSIEPSQQDAVQQFFLAERKGLIADWMRGKHSSEDINMFLAEKIGVPYRQLWKTFQADCRTMNIPEALLAKILSLGKKFTIILATDNMDCFSRFTVPALDLKNYFDDIINSADVGICKNDEAGKFFENIAKRYELPVTKGILIDDSEKTCQIFSGLGGKAFLVTHEQTCNYWLNKLTSIS